MGKAHDGRSSRRGPKQVLFFACVGVMAWMPALHADETDAVIGTWKLNLLSSRGLVSLPKSVIRRYQSTSAGMRVIETSVDQTGVRSYVEYTAKYDGKEYPVLTSFGDGRAMVRSSETIALQRLDQFTVAGTGRIEGKVVYEFKRVLSRDGRRLTISVLENQGT